MKDPDLKQSSTFLSDFLIPRKHLIISDLITAGTYRACNKTLAVFIITTPNNGCFHICKLHCLSHPYLRCGIVNVSGSNMAVSLPFPGCHKAQGKKMASDWGHWQGGWQAQWKFSLPLAHASPRVSPGSDSRKSAPPALWSLLHILCFRSLPCSFSLFRHTDNPDFPSCNVPYSPVGLYGCGVSCWVNWFFLEAVIETELGV